MNSVEEAIVRKDAEIAVLRELLTTATISLDGEFGDGRTEIDIDDEYLIPHLIWVKLHPDLPRIT